MGNGLRAASWAEALESHRKAVAIRERLVRDNPTVTQYPADLASSYHNIGGLLFDTGNPTEALESERRALEIWEPLVRNNPSAHKYQNSLGVTLHKIAEIEIRQRLWRETPGAPGAGDQASAGGACGHAPPSLLSESFRRPPARRDESLPLAPGAPVLPRQSR